MTEKRFTYIKNSSITQYQSIPIQKIGKGKPFHCQGLVDELNKLWNENEELKKELNAYKNFSDRKLAENKRIHKDWDKLWQLCIDKGFTEEELIKELER